MTFWRKEVSVGRGQIICGYVFKISKEKIKNFIYIDNLEHIGHTRHTITTNIISIVSVDYYVMSKELDKQAAL